MRAFNLHLLRGFLFVLILFLAACAGPVKRPCTEGGDIAREYKKPFRGTRQCYQEKDKFGRWLNNGKYFEWYENGQLAVEGEYKLGRKVGRWKEYDEKGKKTFDKILDEPVEEKKRERMDLRGNSQ